MTASPALWAKLAISFVLAAVAVVVVPRLASGGDQPNVGMLLATGVVVAALTTGALYFALRRDLGLPGSIALYAVGYNALVVLVKFVLGPHGLYDVSEAGKYDPLFNPSSQGSAVIVGIGLFVLYAIALLVIYRLCRRRLVRVGALAARPRPSVARVIGIAVLAAAILLASAGLPLMLLLGGLDYAGWVFSSGVSLLVALALAGAIALASLALRSTAERAALVGDAALLVTVFWIGLAFLALYQALWVVYVLVLTSIWPLKVVTPK